jgi:hypothetical protein
MDRRLQGWTLPAAGIGVPLLAVLVAILVLEPYYGVVDDAILLGYAQVPPPSFRYALVDARLRPAAVDRAKWRAVWTPSRGGGFVLYQSTAEDDG